ncbi:hypothetical protein K1719_003550 [Acacia pycnantha]|nr:hypothetical protein K1719_003550 [Acacia pycnantha]
MKRKLRGGEAWLPNQVIVCWWEWEKSDEEDVKEDYGVETDFAKVLNSSDGISVDFSNPLCPVFSFEEKEKERLQKPFKRTLVVKLMGRQPSFGFMVKKLRQIWERKGKIDVFDLENDFYLVNFQRSEDYMEALTGGPWVIIYAYLSFARWKPEFNPKNEKINSVIAWVRFPDLPATLFNKKFLLNLGNSIGRAIRLDIHTAQRARGKFARMCVELDLTKPLVPEFKVEGQLLSVVYESLGHLCNKCGRVGHMKENCDKFHNNGSAVGMEVEEPNRAQEQGNNKGDDRELWKTVQRPRRPRKNDMVFQATKSGSRFDVLHTETAEEEQRGGVGSSQGNINVPIVRDELKAKGQQKLRSRLGSNKIGPGAKKDPAGRRKSGVLTPVAEFVLKQSFDNQHGYSIKKGEKEHIFEVNKGKSISPAEKENLHPCEYGKGTLSNEAMDMGVIQDSATEDDPIASLGTSVGEVVSTAILAD